MTVERIVTPERYIGVSTDTKPTHVRAGATFKEYDTGSTYITHNGYDWVVGYDLPLIPYGHMAAAGAISGRFAINKFGRNTEIDATVVADIWNGGHTTGALPAGTSLIWVAPTAAAKHNIASTSTSDDGNPAGVGARTIRIYGLPDWNTAEISEDITMNGTTNVETANSYVIIHRMKVLTKGATSSNVGTITATAKAPSTTTVTARIEVGKGQTEMAIYGFPSTQKFYLYALYAFANKAGGAAALADVNLLFNPEPDAELTNFLSKHPFGLQTVGTSGLSIHFTVPEEFEGPGIFKVQGFSGTNDMDISAGFDGILVTK